MDLMDFEGQALYFDEELPAEVATLIDDAADAYDEGDPEFPLLRAYLLAPRHLSVLVALYRYYYYAHRLEDALVVADHALAESGQRLNFPADWSELNEHYLGFAVQRSMGMVRFYLLALKAAGLVYLRLGQFEEGTERLNKVMELDPHDRLGAKALLEVVTKVSDFFPDATRRLAG